MTYVHNNLECVVSLLDYVAHKKPQPAYVYASSSSVYGLNKKIPFSELHAIDHPANLYGTSKFADEQIAAAYHNIHGLKSVGLRFFTVYGPYGRPDLALFKFVDAILDGRPIDIYNHGDMYRDFTYVTDLVRGIRLLIDTPPVRPDNREVPEGDSLSPVAPYRIVNIGNSDKVRLLDFVDDDMVDREDQLDLSELGLQEGAPGDIDLVHLHQGASEAHVPRGEQRVGHGAADEDLITARDQRVDHADLVGDLGATDDRSK